MERQRTQNSQHAVKGKTQLVNRMLHGFKTYYRARVTKTEVLVKVQTNRSIEQNKEVIIKPS